MLEINFITQNKNHVINGLKRRNLPNPEAKIEDLLAVDKQRREAQLQLDNTNAEIKNISKFIEQLIKSEDTTNIEKAKTESIILKTKTDKLREELANCSTLLKDKLSLIPNIPHLDVPDGLTIDQNQVVCENNITQTNKYTPLAHWDLIKKHNLINFELGNKITGPGFPVYIGKGAKLQRALINLFLDLAIKDGYTEIQPPIVVNADSAYGTGQLPDMEGQMYQLIDEKLYLIPTAEVPVTNILRNEIINLSQLPTKYVSYTPCFRREAGSWGSHVRGLNRLHQFDKVELVQITHPNESYKTIESMLQYLQNVLDKLELHYRVLKLCCGEMGSKATLQYDIEVWSSGQKKWLEVSSLSNFETYQANRMGIRYRDDNNKISLAHTLNGSSFGMPRILAALLENNQISNNDILLPKVLHSYTGFDKIN
jgi:seryl-tRNA synthetase